MGGFKALGGFGQAFASSYTAANKQISDEKTQKEVDRLKADDRTRRQQKFWSAGNVGPVMKKGGIVRKTGVARVHKGEMVIPAKMARQMKRLAGRKASGR